MYALRRHLAWQKLTQQKQQLSVSLSLCVCVCFILEGVGERRGRGIQKSRGVAKLQAMKFFLNFLQIWVFASGLLRRAGGGDVSVLSEVNPCSIVAALVTLFVSLTETLLDL